MKRTIKYEKEIFEVDVLQGGKIFIDKAYYESKLGFLASNGIWLSRNEYEVIA